MTFAPELIIDSDSHITEPRDVWTARVPAKFRDVVPHVVERDRVETWIMQDKPLTPVGVTAPAGWPTFPPEYPPTLRGLHPGAYDARARLEYMDGAGIWAQVLVPERRRVRQPKLPDARRRGAEAPLRHRLQRLPARVGLGGYPPPPRCRGYAVLGHRGHGARRSSVASPSARGASSSPASRNGTACR